MLNQYGWWVATLVLIAAEAASGSFYLLMVAFGFAAGGVASWLGFDFPVQAFASAVVGLGAVALWHVWRKKHHALPAQSSHAPHSPQHLDLGATVDVESWHDGRARVEYRGSYWDAVPEHPDAAITGRLFIKAVRANVLVLGTK